MDAILHSLLQVQDRIAAGDSDAFPLQKRLMLLLGASIAESGRDHEMTDNELRAMLIYGVVGSKSISTVQGLREINKSNKYFFLGQAIADYHQGKRNQSIKRFSKVDVEKLDERLKPFVQYALGNLLARSAPTKAIQYYNLVRLNAPGTLLEEASLRRLMVLHTIQGNGKNFTVVARQYARRFIKSPYRQHFISTLQSGIVKLRRSMSLEEIALIGSAMPVRFAASYYMKIIRISLTAGRLKTASFSIKKLLELDKKYSGVRVNKHKLELLQLLSLITTEDPVLLYKKLSSVETAKLSNDDKKLLFIARGLLNTILSPIDQLMVSSTLEDEALDAKATIKRPSSSDENKEVSPGTIKGGKQKEEPDKQDEFDAFIHGVKGQLKAVDKVLRQ